MNKVLWQVLRPSTKRTFGKAQVELDVRRAQQGVEAMMAWSKRPMMASENRQIWDLEVVSGVVFELILHFGHVCRGMCIAL